MLNARTLLGSHDVLLLTFDTLRWDVAEREYAAGGTPNLASWLPPGGWERRHSPASFTYAAHQAFFAGFLPTPPAPGPHPRLFAARFIGSETTVEQTLVFDAPDIVSGFRAKGYHTLCIGGVGFFNQRTPLGRVLPSLFEEAHWAPELGVADPASTANQVALACARIAVLPTQRRLFLFLNLSAIHPPTYHYLPGAGADSLESHAAALRYVDAQLPPLLALLRRRAPLLCVLCSDHGSAFGEDGYHGHRLAHPVVWDVPYAEFVLPQEP